MYHQLLLIESEAVLKLKKNHEKLAAMVCLCRTAHHHQVAHRVSVSWAYIIIFIIYIYYVYNTLYLYL